MDNIIEELQNSIFEYDSEKAREVASDALDKGIDPLSLMETITKAIKKVGDDFESESLWLPDLVGAAKAMEAVSEIIDAEIHKKGISIESTGTIVIGTVFGDIHSIGKNMVVTLLKSAGFTVYDLGINVQATEFLKAIRKFKPDILAMSALMTSTASEQKTVISTLEKENLRQDVRVIVGGGAATRSFADSIGADGYEPTAPKAAKLASRLIEESKR